MTRETTAHRKITISYLDRGNLLWAGDGTITDDGLIRDCAAQLGETPELSEETYEAIEEQIADGETRGEVVRPDCTYTWRITTAEACRRVDR